MMMLFFYYPVLMVKDFFDYDSHLAKPCVHKLEIKQYFSFSVSEKRQFSVTVEVDHPACFMY
jgi:hypothetical protein